MVAALRKIAWSPRVGRFVICGQTEKACKLCANPASTPPEWIATELYQRRCLRTIEVRLLSVYLCRVDKRLDQKGMDHDFGLQMVELRKLQRHLQQPVLSLCVLPFTVRTEQHNSAEVATYPCCYYGTPDESPLPASHIP